MKTCGNRLLKRRQPNAAMPFYFLSYHLSHLFQNVFSIFIIQRFVCFCKYIFWQGLTVFIYITHKRAKMFHFFEKICSVTLHPNRHIFVQIKIRPLPLGEGWLAYGMTVCAEHNGTSLTSPTIYQFRFP